MPTTAFNASLTPLTERDVQRLLTDSTHEARIGTAAKLSRQFAENRLNDQERLMAEEIFRIMVLDTEMRVRKALSENLKEALLLPKDIALTLAEDIDAVALPMLRYSDVLEDADLIAIIRSHSRKKQTAVASRAHLSKTVSASLVDEGDKEAIRRLTENTGADIPEHSFHQILDRFGEDDSFHRPLVKREILPITVTERLVSIVSEELKEALLTHHDMSPDLAADLMIRTRERITVGLSSHSTEDDLVDLISQLSKHGRLTPSLIFRALCMGDLAFFEYAMAEAAHVPILNTRILLYQGGRKGLRALYEQTHMPDKLLPLIETAMKVAASMEYDGHDFDRERFSCRMIERILTFLDPLNLETESDDLDYLLDKMAELPDLLL